METIRVVKCEIGKYAREHTIVDSLESYQSEVGGFIEIFPIEGNLVAVLNEEGKLFGKPNRTYYENGKAIDVFYGDFFITATECCEFRSLTDEEVDVTIKKFYKPEAEIGFNLVRVSEEHYDRIRSAKQESGSED